MRSSSVKIRTTLSMQSSNFHFDEKFTLKPFHIVHSFGIKWIDYHRICMHSTKAQEEEEEEMNKFVVASMSRRSIWSASTLNTQIRCIFNRLMCVCPVRAPIIHVFLAATKIALFSQHIHFHIGVAACARMLFFTALIHRLAYRMPVAI